MVQQESTAVHMALSFGTKIIRKVPPFFSHLLNVLTVPILRHLSENWGADGGTYTIIQTNRSLRSLHFVVSPANCGVRLHQRWLLPVCLIVALISDPSQSYNFRTQSRRGVQALHHLSSLLLALTTFSFALLFWTPMLLRNRIQPGCA